MRFPRQVKKKAEESARRNEARINSRRLEMRNCTRKGLKDREKVRKKGKKEKATQ